MSSRILRTGEHRSLTSARRLAGKIVRGAHYALMAGLAARHLPTALTQTKRAFAGCEPRRGGLDAALRLIAGRLAALRRDASRETGVLDALLAAAHFAAARLHPAGLQSYVEVTVRTTAIRAFAEYVARGGKGGAEPLLARLAGHAPQDRAVLLAFADWLIDHDRPDEAEPLVRRALRMNAVCQTAQRLLGRLAPDDYDLSDKFCPMPFTHLSTSYKADAFACCCSAWQPYSIGSVTDAPSAESVWNSEAAQEIRRSIHDGDFTYCSRTLCSFIAARTLPTKAEIEDPILRGYVEARTVQVVERPTMVELNHDPSCNLACPSCRTAVTTAGPAEQKAYVDAADRVLLPFLRDAEGWAYISGGGEAFASTHYKKILAALNRRDFPRLYIHLISNGQLLNEQRWQQFPDLPEMIGLLSISVDAARAATYEQLRRPGKWHVLMQNLGTIAQMRAQGRLRGFEINFVVQAANFRELPEFIDLGSRLGVDNIWLQRLTNYGSYPDDVFERIDVTSPQHPDHEELLAILRPYVGDPRIKMDMLLPLFPEVVETEVAHYALRTRFHVETAGLLPVVGTAT